MALVRALPFDTLDSARDRADFAAKLTAAAVLGGGLWALFTFVLFRI